MSHFLDRLTYLPEVRRHLLERTWRRHHREPRLGGGLPVALGARQDRALHPWRQLHRLLLLENLRQGRDRDMGDAADRLPAHAPRPAQPRAARLLPWRVLFLVPLQREPAEIPDDAQAPGHAVARGEGAVRRSGDGVEIHPGRSRQAARIPVRPRPWRLRARGLGGGRGTGRRRQRAYGEAARARPGDRLLAHPGDVDGELCRWQPRISR